MFQQLVEGDCGGVNPLMQIGTQFTRDFAHRDDGLQNLQSGQQNGFLGQVASDPTSYNMQTLLQEMRDIEEKSNAQIVNVVNTGAVPKQTARMTHVHPQQQQYTNVIEFFDEGTQPLSLQRNYMPQAMPRYVTHQSPLAVMPTASFVAPPPTMMGDNFFAEAAAIEKHAVQQEMQDMNFFENMESELDTEAAVNHNEKFWQNLQDQWSKMSTDAEHSWLSDYENYDPYKDYEYVQDNPMANIENAFEQGKEYLAAGDVPSAVLCFETASQQQPENAEVWELLGLSQAENEMDPQAIAALKRANELQPNNRRVLMALAICYTNESFQNQALKMLVNWLDAHPKYKPLLDKQPELRNANSAVYTSLAPDSRLKEIQRLFLNASRLNVNAKDADIFEALGVLYNLSSDYEQAVESFHTALSINPQNAKLWNRLGASLANGSRSSEAVQAYQRALELEPGFIRVRYNVGVCCMNLKAYAQAAEHLLTALNMQANAAADREVPMSEASVINSGQQKMSDTIWSTLKMVLTLLGRNELQVEANNRNLPLLNKEFNLA